MDSPWGPIAVSDAHVHFLSSRFFAALAEPQKVADLGIEVPADEAGLAARWVAELDRYDLRSASLIASIAGDEESVRIAVEAFPDRFYGYFMVDPTMADAAGRVARALGAGLRGVCFFPAMHRYAMHDERVTSVLNVIAQYPGTIAFVHCGVLSVGIRAKLGLPSRFDMRFSNPLDLHAQALHFANINFVIPHFGAGMFREALMLADLCSNVYFDTSSTNSWLKYQTPRIALIDVFRQSLDLLGPRRLLFGTDSSVFPRGWNRPIFESQAGILSELGTKAEDAQLIFGGNLRRLVLGSNSA